MTITTDLALPTSPQDLPVENDKPFFILFIASTDPITNEPWCSDVRAALPVMRRLFDSEGTLQHVDIHIVEVGQKEAWKILDNVYRTTWGLKAVPSLVRYERGGEEVEEMGKVVEGELLDEGRLEEFVR